MKKHETESVKITYTERCSICKRTIKGNSKGMCKHNMKAHKWNKHPELEGKE